VCRAVSQQICAGLTACGCRFDVRAYDAAGCVDARTADCVAGFAARVQPDVDAGRVRFDDASIAACLADLDALADGCALAHGGESPLPASCDRLVLATAAIDGDCGIGGLAYCGDGAGLCIPGESGSRCTRLPGDGEPCLQGFCAGELVCHPGTEPSPPTCGPRRAADAPCIIDRECQDGLVCTPAGACAAPGAAGAACADNLDCAEGLACVGEKCATATALGEGCRGPQACGAAASCGRAPETRTCGAADGSGAMCEEGSCADGLACGQATMTCEALPGVSQPCLDGAACGAGLTCAFSTQTCVALPGAGQPCFADGSTFCAPGLGCRESDQTCQPASVATAGEPCLLNPPDYVCAPGLGCDFGAAGSICMPLGGVGTPCNNDRTCAADTYCDFGTGACAARLPDGSACKDGNECEVGSECEIRAGKPSCGKIPGASEPCFQACTGDLACQGPGGQCVPELCVIP
jgi:hypothetical protein